MFPDPFVDYPTLYRVDVPDYSNAVATSAYGSVVESPPLDQPWRLVNWAVVDTPFGESDNIVDPQAMLDALNVEPWHAANVQGQSVKIAVFDVEWLGADWANGELGTVSTHDCFAHPSCELPLDSSHPRFGFERGVHGIACAEVIRDIAPEAELHLVRVLGLTSLENAVDWAIRADMDFVSMSLSFFNESFYDGTGPISSLMNKLRANDVVMVTSAGNYARGHHRTTFVDENLDRQHDFEDARGLPIYWTPGRRSVQIVWDDFQQCGWNDVNAYLWSRSGELLAKSLRQQSPYTDNCHPSESIVANIDTEQWTFLTIENLGYGQPQIDIMARGGYVYQTQIDNSIVDPGMHPSVLTVGAVRADDYTNQSLESFSSVGALNTPIAKPEVVGPNGVSTLSYGSKNFFGTSASTPAVTGALALYKNAHPTLSNYELTQQLIHRSIPDNQLLETSTFSEYGKVRLPSPIEQQHATCSGSPVLFSCLLYWGLSKARRSRIGYTN